MVMLKQKKCKKCGELIREGFYHFCGETELTAGVLTAEQERKVFKSDILQPYTKEHKVNGDFVKRYGRDKHPKFNNKIIDNMKKK